MASYDKRVDAYIVKSASFAQPILEHIRELVHNACPDIEETIKWSFPHFEYKGIVCSMASFKYHCAFGFWKGSVMEDPKGILSTVGKTAMGNLNRIKSIDDLPSDKIMMDYIRQAVRLNEDEIQPPAKKVKKAATPLKVPEYFTKILNKNKKALATFTALSTSHRNDYVWWITEAKQEETRKRRLTQAIELLKEGKSRDWKYQKK